MQILILVMLIFSIAMPLGYVIRVWRLDEPTLSAWLLVIAETLSFVGFVLLLARWDIAGLYTRYLLAVALAAAILVSWLWHRRRPWRITGETLWRRRWPNLLFLAGFAGILAFVLPDTLPNADARLLASPLGAGRFMVVHGSGNTLLNYHAAHKAQHYAIDIVALNRSGFRVPGICPTTPSTMQSMAYRSSVPVTARLSASAMDFPICPRPKQTGAIRPAIISCLPAATCRWNSPTSRWAASQSARAIGSAPVSKSPWWAIRATPPNRICISKPSIR
jgi:hypothetical protein